MNTEQSDSSAMRQQWQLAASSFKKAISLDSLDANSYTNLGVVCYRLNELDQSVRYTQKAITLNPDDPSLYGNLGDAYFALKEYEKAANTFKQVIGWKDATIGHYKRYGISLFSLKRYPESVAVFKKGIQKFPNDTEMASNLGSAYGAAANYNEAGRVFEGIYSRDSLNVNALRLLILSYEQAGNREKVAQYSGLLK